MSYARQYMRHTAFSVATAVAMGLLFYLLRIVLYNQLSVADYGLVYAVLAFATMAHPFISFGFDPGVVPHITRLREEGAYHKIANLVFSALAAVSLVAVTVVAIVWVAAPPVAGWLFPQSAALWAIRFAALYAVSMALYKIGCNLLFGLQFIGPRSIVEVGVSACCLIAAYILAQAGMGAAGAVAAYFASALVGAAATFILAWSLCPELFAKRPRWEPDLTEQAFRSGKYLTIAVTGAVLFTQIDTAMLTLLLRDLESVAAYQLAVPTIMILFSLTTAAARNFMPMATTLAKRGEMRLLADGIGRMYDLAAVFLLPAGAIAAAFGDVLMPLLFRRDVMDGPAAFAILAWGACFHFLGYLNLQILAGLGRTRHAALAIGSALGVNLVLNAILIPLAGIQGAATATVISLAAATGFSAWFIRKALPLRARPVTIVTSVAVAVVTLGAARFLRDVLWPSAHPVLFMFIWGPVFFVGAIVFLELIGASRIRDFSRIIREVRQKESMNA